MAQDNAAPRILIADDDPQGVELLEAMLMGTDYDVQTTADGEAALRKAQEWRPDVLLLDIMMPRMSGFEVCKKIKSHPALRDIVILMVTALDQGGDIDRAVDVGANDFLTKPINKNELLIRVRAALESRKHKNAVDQAVAYMEGVQGS